MIQITDGYPIKVKRTPFRLEVPVANVGDTSTVIEEDLKRGLFIRTCTPVIVLPASDGRLYLVSKRGLDKLGVQNSVNKLVDAVLGRKAWNEPT